MSVVRPPKGKTWTQCVVDSCQNSRLIQGMCGQCASKELTRLREEREDEPSEMIRLRKTARRLLDERRKLRCENDAAQEAITELRQDVTRKIEAVKDAEREIKRMRGIEAAWLDGRTPRTVRAYLVQFCDDVPLHVEAWLNRIADALEAK